MFSSFNCRWFDWCSCISLPPLVLGALRLATDLFYAVTYSSNWQCRNDIAHLGTLINNIQETEIKSEAKYLFESLINRGKINELLGSNFSFTQMLRAGVEDNFLLEAIPIGHAQRGALRNAIAHVALQHMHVVAINL